MGHGSETPAMATTMPMKWDATTALVTESEQS